MRPSAARPRLRRRAPPSAGPSRAEPAAAPPGSRRPPGASPRGPEGGRRAEPPPPPAAGEEEGRGQARLAGVVRAPQGARVEPAGGGEGVIAPPPPRPSPAPSPSPPPDSGPATRTSEACGGRTGRPGPGRRRRRSEHTRAHAGSKIHQGPAPGPEHSRRGSPRTPSLELAHPPVPAAILQHRTGRGGGRRRSAAVAGSPLSGPSGGRGQRPELLRQKGQKRAGPRLPPPAPALRLLSTVWIMGPCLPLSIKGGGVSLW